VNGPTIHTVIMDERTTDLFEMIEREVKRGLLTFQMPLVAGIEEAIRQAYLRGVRDGFQQGALAAASETETGE
jgi:hypothetical protein